MVSVCSELLACGHACSLVCPSGYGLPTCLFSGNAHIGAVMLCQCPKGTSANLLHQHTLNQTSSKYVARADSVWCKGDMSGRHVPRFGCLAWPHNQMTVAGLHVHPHNRSHMLPGVRFGPSALSCTSLVDYMAGCSCTLLQTQIWYESLHLRGSGLV